MNYLKTKIALLSIILVLQAGKIDAAAHQQERSVLQRAKAYMSEHPIATGLIGMTSVAGFYELAAHKFGLPTLSNAGMLAFEKLKTDRESQVLAAGAALAGAYELTAKPLGLPTIRETIKKDLITRSDNAEAYPAPLEQLIRLVPGGDALFLPREDQPAQHPAALYHIAHGVRLYCYSVALSYAAMSIMAKFPTTFNESQQMGHTDLKLSKISMAFAILGVPLLEELTDTYLPNAFLGKWAQVCMPVIFGCSHLQYNMQRKIMCGLANLLHNRSLHMRPEYQYGPIISHVIHNSVALGAYFCMKHR